MSEKRRFPMEENFMKGDKTVSTSKPNDILYGYLQSISYITDDKTRFVYRDHYSPTVVQDFFGVNDEGKYHFNRLAVTRAMRVLIQYGYVKESKVIGIKGNVVEVYELPYDETKLFQFIPLETLNYLLAVSHPNVIKLYVYFLNKYKHYQNEFEFTNKRLLLDCFGITSDKNAKTNKDLKSRLNNLKTLGLIDWCEYVKIHNGKKIKIKRLLYVKTYVPELLK